MPDATALSMAEPQAKILPALSATSDMPELKLTPPPISEERVPEQPEPEKTEPPKEGDTPESEATPETQPDAVEDPLKSDKTPAWLKGLATRERNQRREAEARAKASEDRASQLSDSLAKALAGIESLTKAQAANISEEANRTDPQPKREAFDNPDAYDRALIDWSTRRATLIAKAEATKAVEEAQKTQKADAEKAETERQNRVVAEQFAARKAKFAETHPDYEDVVERDDLQITIPMAHTIMTDDDGPAIAYYLGQNPEQAARIAEISKTNPVKAVAELGRIAARLNSKPISTKPAPINPLRTGAATATRKTPNEETMDEYGARRSRELYEARRPLNGAAPN
jgi:hypothetical protein